MLQLRVSNTVAMPGVMMSKPSVDMGACDRWGEGLHQAVEAKEQLPIQNETITLASISYQVIPFSNLAFAYQGYAKTCLVLPSMPYFAPGIMNRRGGFNLLPGSFCWPCVPLSCLVLPFVS